MAYGLLSVLHMNLPAKHSHFHLQAIIVLRISLSSCSWTHIAKSYTNEISKNLNYQLHFPKIILKAHSNSHKSQTLTLSLLVRF
jgi:hypothetical protein